MHLNATLMTMLHCNIVYHNSGTSDESKVKYADNPSQYGY